MIGASARAAARSRSRRRGWVAERLGGERRDRRDHARRATAARAVGDKSRWVDTIERALLAGEIDLAVHSAKDVPGELADGTEIVAVAAARGPARRADRASLGAGRRSGRRRCAGARSCSPARRPRGRRAARQRRHAAAQARRRRGATRIVLAARRAAAAGPRRRRRRRWTRSCPAPGQGALALQARVGDERGRTAVAAIDDAAAAARCLPSERAACACWAPTATRRSASTPTGGRVRGLRRRGPTARRWVLDEVPSRRLEALARARPADARRRRRGSCSVSA